MDQKFAGMISDQAVRDSLHLALTQLHTATCENNKPCARATPGEFEKPPITLQDGRAAMTFAIKSALATWCGLDWKRSFLPMIAFGKRHQKMSDRQMQVMSLMHADFQRRQLAFYTKQGACPTNLKEKLDAELPRL